MNLEKEKLVSDILKEHGVECADLTGKDAIIQLQNTIGQVREFSDYELVKCDYGLMATDFDILTMEAYKKVNTFMLKCRLQSLWIGFDCKTRVKIDIRYRKKASIAIIEPSLILWEFTGVTYESAEIICREVSEMIGHDLRIISQIY